MADLQLTDNASPKTATEANVDLFARGDARHF